MASFGEFDLISRLRRFQRAGGNGAGADALVVGMGDDAAVLRADHECEWLYAADMSVEGVHFRTDYSSLEDIGWKAMASNVSDIAAMGGLPVCALVSLSLPEGVRSEDVERLYEGLTQVTERFGAVIAGGDLVDGPAWTVSIALLGRVERGRAVLRSGARPGDAIYVTHTLGDSAAGLSLLKAEETGKRSLPERVVDELLTRYRRPVPRVEEGRGLARYGALTAMMDLSDGLAGDIRHICRAAGVGALIEADSIPLSEALRYLERDAAVDPLELTLSGGEDYELLFTVRGDRTGELEGLGHSVHRVGEILPASQGILLRAENGDVAPLRAGGFVHGRRGAADT